MPRRGSSAPRAKRGEMARLSSQLAALVEESRALRDVLVRNERAAAKLQRQLARNESVIDALEALEGAMNGPRELPEAIDRFEATRREARHALFALATTQEVSMGEMARRFGFSRQLASRILQEARTSTKTPSRKSRAS